MIRAPHQYLCLFGLVTLCLVSFHLATADADSLDTSLDTNEPHLPHFHPTKHHDGGEKEHQHSSPEGSKGGHHPGSKLGKHKKRHRRHKFDHHARAHLFDDKHRGHLITGPFGSGPKKRGIQRDKEGHIKLLYCVEGMALTHEEGGPHPMAAAKEPSVLCPWVDGVCCGDGHSCCPYQFACLATGGCRHSDKPLPNIPGYRPHPPTKAEIAAEMARQGHPMPVGPGQMAAPTSPIPGRMAYPPFPMFGPYPPPPPPQIVQPPVPKITIISNDNGLWAPKNGQQKSN